MRLVTPLGAALLCALACAQQRPRFDVADVHVSAPGGTEDGGALPDGLEFRSVTLLRLIREAYGVPDERVVGGPSWLDTDRYDVLAKTSGAARLPALRAMLQSLIEERFGLTIARGEKAVPAYVLTAEGSGALKQSDGGAAPECRDGSEGNVRMLTCRNTTLAELLEALPRFAHGTFELPIVDRTGLDGAYDFKVRYAPQTQSIFDVLEQQTGIRVERRTAPVAVLTVERVNRTPAPNPPGTAERLGAPPATFDVATIRPSRPEEREDLDVRNGRIDARAVNLRDLIGFAYNVEEQWVRGEKWIESARYDLVAKSAPTVSDDMLRPMVRALLEERFHLKAHQEQQPVEVYALVAAKPKLKAADPATRAGCKAAPTATTRSYICRNATLDRLVERLNHDSGGYLEHKLIDRTGLAGAYDFTLTWTLPFSIPKPESGQVGLTLFEAVERQLGLKLIRRKHPMPVLIVDHIDRQPAEN